MALVDFIPDDPLASIKNAPSAATKRVYGRILFADDSSTTVPPSVQLTGFPVYDNPDETHIYGKPYDAKLVDPTGSTTLAGIWFADIPVTDDPDIAPGGVFATINHPAWPSPETRRVFANYPNKVRWIDCDLALPLADEPVVTRVWIGDGFQGQPGPEGPQGPSGSGTGSGGVTKSFATPVSQWDIPYDFAGRLPSVTLYDTSGVPQWRDYTATATLVTVVWPSPMAGKAVLN
jgi:hypothetical protein